ncbi:MAG: App1 family protein [Beutenbergiaceae bacterium]
MSGSHIAARMEDSFHRRLIPLLRARGWKPRTTPYIGYGSTGFLRVLGRVIMGRHIQAEANADSATSAQEFAEAVLFQRGWRSYVTAPVSYLPVTVRIGHREYHTKTDRTGYLDFEILDHGLAPGWHEITIAAKAARPETAAVLIIADDAPIGLISDIDDTVMVTSVPRPLIAIWNTFIRHGSARKVVPGMALMYREFVAQHPHAPVFYISTGAWNIAPTLIQVMRTPGYPPGALLMTDWGPTNNGWFRSGVEHKRNALRRLSAEFPHMRWVLVGDDGQHDPMIYREFATEHPDRTLAIAIRQLTPGEQVLAHGTLTATAETVRTPMTAQTPEITGPDGNALGPRLRAVLNNRRRRH